ncbi:MAG: right-handed parallel beta-helix repeat-containing protein [Anaerolineae bacterium]|nr:right-handed parallel beta-helix repeat-containing protein [Anaerolineae bacterium]MDW8099779.1 right-handed parallel beta-helix repeat-containing protein [Anaerolineae bacterium]
MSIDVNPEARGETIFYVSPEGNDAWSGHLPSPDPSGADGPFATLQQAQRAVRKMKWEKGQLPGPVTVYVRKGIYFLKEPLVFTPEDSGVETAPVAYVAYPGEHPILSGGQPITNWQRATTDGRPLWMAVLPEVAEGKWFFRQLWVNGQRRQRARHPNYGYLRVAELLDHPEQWFEGQSRFRFHEGDLKAWPTASAAEIVVMNRWVESRLPIASIDEAERVVCCHRRSVFRLDPDDPYYVEHAFEVLDMPGEWFLDRESGKLYYWPLPYEDLNQVQIIAPVLTQVMRMEGEPRKDGWVEYLVFRGLSFAHTEWYFPPEPQEQQSEKSIGGFPQAAVGVPGAVYGEGIRHCVFEDCTIAHVGTYGLELGRGCRNNRILGCEITDLGAGGVKIGETVIREDADEQTYGNEISDCRIYDGGHVFHSAVGIWIGQSYGNRLVHNEVADFYYTGISIGWTWGYDRSLAGSNLVAFNHVHHIGIRRNGEGPILSDMGGIYTLGIQEGTVIHHNLWHDIAGIRYGGWGIYFDEGSTGITAENNLVYNTTHGGFHQHYGRANVVRNNVFAYARDHQLQASRAETHLRFQFERNIVLGRSEQWLAGEVDFNFVFDHNLYWREDEGPIRFGHLTWDEWRARGMDEHSILADPKFRDPKHGDFYLQPGSPAEQIGFQPFDLSSVGPRIQNHHKPDQ